ncbi:MAG TPA: hypothetical protein VGM84_10230 [Steroidobacteraceae bacterium]|jgi:hypothetical protein
MRILFIGEQPESVDFNDPALPPGLTAQKIHAGINQALQAIDARGWQGELCLIPPDDSGVREVERRLASASYDCVVVGGGIRVPPRRLMLFEALINAIHRGAPSAAIAFNTSPENTPDAAQRWLPPG